MGLDQGFDEYDSPFDFRVLSPMSGEIFYAGESHNPYAVRDRRDGSIVIASAIRWLAAHHGQPVFVFVHLFDMHLPYSHGKDYDAQLAYVDQTLGTFKQALVRGGWWDRSVVALLSDHGESLGEHGEASHGYFIYQSTMAVPLMIHWPNAASAAPPAPARELHPVGLIDLAPTILDYLRIPAPATFRGQSLLARKPPFVFGESVHAYDAFGWSPLRSLRIGDYKYIEAPHPELYNLAADPGELHNLAAADTARAQSMRDDLAKFKAGLRPNGAAPATNLSAQQRALLGSLGYVAPGPQTNPVGPVPTPKIAWPSSARTKTRRSCSISIVSPKPSRRYARSSRRIRKTRSPAAIWAAFTWKRSNTRKRAKRWRRCCSPRPVITSPCYQLGLACEHLGLLKQAVEHLEAACNIAPDSVPCKTELDAVRKKEK